MSNQCMDWRGARGRTGVLDGLTLQVRGSQINHLPRGEIVT